MKAYFYKLATFALIWGDLLLRSSMRVKMAGILSVLRIDGGEIPHRIKITKKVGKSIRLVFEETCLPE